MNRKGKSLNKQCFYRNNKMFGIVNSYNTCSKPTIVLSPVYHPADDTLFEVGPQIRCSGVSSRCCWYRNHTASFKPI